VISQRTNCEQEEFLAGVFTETNRRSPGRARGTIPGWRLQVILPHQPNDPAYIHAVTQYKRQRLTVLVVPKVYSFDHKLIEGLDAVWTVESDLVKRGLVPLTPSEPLTQVYARRNLLPC